MQLHSRVETLVEKPTPEIAINAEVPFPVMEESNAMEIDMSFNTEGSKGSK